MKTKSRRGVLLLGMAAAVSLMAVLAYAANSASLSNYREAARLRWRVTARQLALGGLATARARLAENPRWRGETWTVESLGRVEIRIVSGGGGGEGNGGDRKGAAATGVAGGSGVGAGPGASGTVVEILASVPQGDRPLETVALRARLRALSRGGGPLSLESSWWVNAAAVAPPAKEPAR